MVPSLACELRRANAHQIVRRELDARAALPISERVEVLRVPLDPELRGKPVRPKKPKPELPPQL